VPPDGPIPPTAGGALPSGAGLEGHPAGPRGGTGTIAPKNSAVDFPLTGRPDGRSSCPAPSPASTTRERDPLFRCDVVALFQQIGNSGAAASRTATLTVVLPHEFRHFSRVEGSVDADGRRGVPVPFAVLADDKPSTVRPLHDLGMVDLSQRPLQPPTPAPQLPRRDRH
jgi:hypothetical protein